MRILAYNPGHDGAVVLIENDCLMHSIESEKDDGKRHDALTPSLFVRSLEIYGTPDVVAISGYIKFAGLSSRAHALTHATEAGYFDEGEGGKRAAKTLLLGTQVHRFSSSHVRSHLMCSYGLSPFPQGQPCYALVWEGWLGTFYYIDERIQITKIGDALIEPGNKYALLYSLADPTLSSHNPSWLRLEDPGKLMALAAYGEKRQPTDEERELIERIISMDTLFSGRHPKQLLNDSRFCDIGLDSQDFRNLAWQFSNALFERFHAYARANLAPGLPLIIAGGCGLNCEWNSQWKQCGLFSDVFVPPCTNDSGIAIGAAIDALHHYTGRAKIRWSAYAGEDFIMDAGDAPDFTRSRLDLAELCRRLLQGDVIAWIQGRYEIGPRALGNRSLIAEPFSASTRDKLNRIKQREPFRPIAPVCLEEDFGQHFEHHGPSPHMLYFQKVRSGHLAAITHVDGSARAQSVNDDENPLMCELLREFRKQSGAAVLCNTSLNFKGRGFVNRLTHLFALAREQGIDGLVVGQNFWRRRSRSSH